MKFSYKVVFQDGESARLGQGEDFEVKITRTGGVFLFSETPLKLKETKRNKLEIMEEPKKELSPMVMLEEEIKEPIKNEVAPAIQDDQDVLKDDEIEFKLNGAIKTGTVYRLFDDETQEIAVLMNDGTRIVIPASDFVRVLSRGKV